MDIFKKEIEHAEKRLNEMLGEIGSLVKNRDFDLAKIKIKNYEPVFEGIVEDLFLRSRIEAKPLQETLDQWKRMKRYVDHEEMAFKIALGDYA